MHTQTNYSKYPEINSGHTDSLMKGSEFQDFICIEMAKHHFIIQNINTKRFQYNIGENLQGIEIKLDMRFLETNQLSIEIAEKTKIENKEYMPSGIYRIDNSIHYIQGNYDCFYLFSKQFLQKLHKQGKYKEHELPTIKKFYLPIKDADKYCINKYDFKNKLNFNN